MDCYCQRKTLPSDKSLWNEPRTSEVHTTQWCGDVQVIREHLRTRGFPVKAPKRAVRKPSTTVHPPMLAALRALRDL